MSDRAAELGADLQNAEAVPAILGALARAVWFNAHDGAECPDAHLPDLAGLVAWLPECPADARAEADAALTAAISDVAPPFGEAPTGYQWAPVGAMFFALAANLSAPIPDRPGRDLTYSVMLRLEAVHDAWRAAGGRHPLAPVVSAWQRRPSLETWTERQYRNVPAPLAATDHVVPAQDDRPGADHLPFDWDALHAAPPDQPRFEVAYLPTLDPDADSLLPLAMLDLFTSAASRGYGGPVPVPARIGWEVVLALDSAARRGGPAQLNCTLADLHRMVYPATPRWQKRHGPDLVRGLFNLDVARVRWRGDATGGLYPLVEVYRLPSQPDKAEPVVFLSHLPPGSQQGPQADSDLLRHLAAASARQHRMMLSVYCLFDRYGTVNGRLIAPTLPVVQRNAAGYVLDARDKVIAERGAPTRRATHRRAVQTGARETNPEAGRYPWIVDRDLILLGYPFVAATPAARRNQRRRVHEAVVALRDRGALDFKAEYRTPKHGGKPELVALRLLPSAAHVEAHAARWAARKHNRSGA